MNAEQARLKSKLVSEASATHIYSKIMKSVKDATNKGSFECWVYDQIPTETKKVLVNDGYELSEESFHRNEYLIKISW